MIQCRYAAPVLLLPLIACRQMVADTLPAEETISRGLKWLAQVQGDDGGWQFDADRAGSENDATGLAILAYLGAGHTLDSRTFGLSLKRAVEFLAEAAVWEEGRADLRGPGGRLGSHAIAAFALCEIYGMHTKSDAEIRGFVQAAVRQSERWLSGNASGGFGLQPGQPSHIQPTVWHIMLFRAAAHAGLEVSDVAENRVLEGLKQLQLGDECDPTEGPYCGINEPGRDPMATAIGVYGRLLRDWSPLRPWIGCDRLSPAKERQKLPRIGRNRSGVCKLILVKAAVLREALVNSKPKFTEGTPPCRMLPPPRDV